MMCPNCQSTSLTQDFFADSSHEWTCNDCGHQFETPVENSTEEAWDREQWEERGKVLASQRARDNWELGDWLLEGEPHIPDIDPLDIPSRYRRGMVRSDVYSVAEEITGLERNTLRDLASTARRVPRSVRTDALDWTHHRWLVNLLPNADEVTLKRWLDEAVEKRYTIRQLKEAVKGHPPKDAVKERSFRVTVPLRIYETLHDMAWGQRSTVQKVASEFLTEQLATAEMQGARQAYKAQAEFRLKEGRRQVGRRVARDYDPLGLKR